MQQEKNQTMMRAVKIYLPWDEDLVETIHTFVKIANEISQIAWEQKKPIKNFVSLHKLAYKQIKERYLQVNSRLIEYAIRKVAGCYSYKKFKKLEAAVVFKNLAAVFDDRMFKFDNNHLIVWTVRGRKRIHFFLPRVARFLRWWEQKVDAGSITFKLNEKRKIIEGSVCVRVPLPPQKETKKSVGIDLGAELPLVGVDSEGRIFCPSYSEFHKKRKQFLEMRRRLQKKLAILRATKKDAHNTIRKLKQLKSKQRNYTKTFIRWLVKKFLDWCGDATIFIEDLKLPRGKKVKGAKELNRTLSLMPVGLLRNTLLEKAQERGLRVVFVDPKGTSITCPNCGMDGERPKRDVFKCNFCNYSSHADLVGAKNVLARGLSKGSKGGQLREPNPPEPRLPKL